MVVTILLAVLIPSVLPNAPASAATLTRGGFTTSATVPAANFTPGDVVPITARVTSSTTRMMMVYLEVRGPTATRLAQFELDNESFTEGVERSFTVNWMVPVDAATGGYTVEVRIFTPGQGQNPHWNESAAFFTVGMGSAPPAGGPVRIMPLGDSLTDGFTVNGGYRIDLWTMLASAHHSVDFVGSRHNGVSGLADKHHEGHLGWRIDELAGGATPWLQAYRPQIVLLMIGTNDMMQNYDLAGAPSRLSALIDQIRSVVPDAAIVVASIPRNGNGDVQTRILAYNAQIPGIVASKGNKVSYVDAYTAIDPVHLADDGTHLTHNGYGRLAQVWYPAVHSIMNAQFPPTPPPPSPTVCSPRPRMLVTTVRSGPNQLTSTISATGQGNVLRELRFVEARNATIDVAGRSEAGTFSVELPDLPTNVTFVMTRLRMDEAVHVPLVVVDQCGDWTTFVGGGVGAF